MDTSSSSSIWTLGTLSSSSHLAGELDSETSFLLSGTFRCVSSQSPPVHFVSLVAAVETRYSYMAFQPNRTFSTGNEQRTYSNHLSRCEGMVLVSTGYAETLASGYKAMVCT